jgi:hypothetical protein
MNRTILRLPLTLCLALGLTAPAYAQAAGAPAPQPKPKPPAAPRPAPPKSTFRVYGQFDWMAMSASQSFDAILGTSSVAGFGVGGEVLDLWKGLFARVTFGVRGDTGQRVIVADGQVIELGIPLEIGLDEFTLGGGWRQTVHPRVIAYGGAGFLRAGYSEESDFSTVEKKAFRGSTFFGGVELPLNRWLIVGGEVDWRSLPDALGEFPSVSQVFGETNLGGMALRALVGIRR